MELATSRSDCVQIGTVCGNTDEATAPEYIDLRLGSLAAAFRAVGNNGNGSEVVDPSRPRKWVSVC